MNTKLEECLEYIARGKRSAAKDKVWGCAYAAAKLAGVEVYPDPQDRSRRGSPDFVRLEKDCRAALEPEVIIVTRHSGLVEWLKRRGITGKVIAHVESPTQVETKIVIGALPFHLAAEAARVGVVSMPELPAEKRGQDLTPEEMDAYGAELRFYFVLEVAP